MRRIVTANRISEDQVRHRVKILGDPCPADSQESRILQHRMLQDLASTPELTVCHYSPFQLLKMLHDGERWVIEAEAVVDEPLEM